MLMVEIPFSSHIVSMVQQSEGETGFVGLSSEFILLLNIYLWQW